MKDRLDELFRSFAPIVDMRSAWEYHWPLSSKELTCLVYFEVLVALSPFLWKAFDPTPSWESTVWMLHAKECPEPNLDRQQSASFQPCCWLVTGREMQKVSYIRAEDMVDGLGEEGVLTLDSTYMYFQVGLVSVQQPLHIVCRKNLKYESLDTPLASNLRASIRSCDLFFGFQAGRIASRLRDERYGQTEQLRWQIIGMRG